MAFGSRGPPAVSCVAVDDGLLGDVDSSRVGDGAAAVADTRFDCESEA